eukprot:1157402-Pelagomonas_calceolata.AAC.3
MNALVEVCATSNDAFSWDLSGSQSSPAEMCALPSCKQPIQEHSPQLSSEAIAPTNSSDTH